MADRAVDSMFATGTEFDGGVLQNVSDVNGVSAVCTRSEGVMF